MHTISADRLVVSWKVLAQRVVGIPADFAEMSLARSLPYFISDLE